MRKKAGLALSGYVLVATSFFILAAHAQTPVRAPANPDPASRRLNLPLLGEQGGLDLAAERRLGERIARQIYRDPDYLDDPLLGDYLQSVWQPLLAAARARGDVAPELAERFAWELMLAKDRSVNAFALPGGYLGVHLGLLSTVGNVDELASVLAHELSHVSQRHISRIISRQDQQAPWIIGAMILGALAASASKNVDMAQAAVVGGQAVAAQSQLNFSRDMEREADRVGYGVMTHAGFQGLGCVTMLEELQRASRLNDDGSFPYLRSHPLSTERMADMRARLPQKAAGGTDAPHAARASHQHALMAARARVLAEPNVARRQAWIKEALETNASSTSAGKSQGQAPKAMQTLGQEVLWLDEAGRQYAAALSAMTLQMPVDAFRLAGRLLLWPDLDDTARKTLGLLLLEIWSGPGAAAQLQVASTVTSPLRAGEVSIKALLAQIPDLAARALQATDRASVIQGSHAMLLLGHSSEVSQRLQWWVSLSPRDAIAWALLARAWSAQGQTLRAIRAEAESRAAQHDVSGAVDRLRSAQEASRTQATADHVEQSIIDTRMRQLQQQLRELEREKDL